MSQQQSPLNSVCRLNCHCGDVVLQPPHLPQRLTECNCSICARYAPLWGYFSFQQVALSVGDMGLQYYTWGDCELRFARCARCGCVTHYEEIGDSPERRLALNFRMAPASAIADLPRRFFDGANLLQPAR